MTDQFCNYAPNNRHSAVWGTERKDIVGSGVPVYHVKCRWCDQHFQIRVGSGRAVDERTLSEKDDDVKANRKGRHSPR